MIQHKPRATQEHTTIVAARMNALRMLAEPLIGHTVEGEALARMIERVTRKDVVMLDLKDELDLLYAEKS